MRIVNRDYETGEYTLECYGHEIRVIKGGAESPRDKDSYFTFINCVKPEVLVDRLGKDETEYGCYKCPDDSNFKPSGNIYVDIIRFSDARHEPPVELTEEMITEAKRVVEERYVVFPVLLSRGKNGKFRFTCNTLRWFKENNLESTGGYDDAVLFGALYAPVDVDSNKMHSVDDLLWVEILVEEYSLWVNDDTYIIDVSMSEELERLVMNANEGLYYRWQENLGWLNTEGYGSDATWDMRNTVTRLNITIDCIKESMDNMNDSELDPEDKADILAALNTK